MHPIYSIVVPCYNEEAVLRETYRRLTDVMGSMGEPYEILFVNDGSRDKTMSILRELAGSDPAVKVVSFARNRGHQIAVSAGLDYATGDAVVIIDADLQDPPELIPQMAEYWKSGSQVVYGQRTHRAGESRFKLLTAEIYYKIINRMTEGMIPRDTGDFRLVDRKVADVVRNMPEHSRFLRGMFSWVGIKQTALPYDRAARYAGETHYPLKKMIRLALDGIIGFSIKPLKISFYTGIIWSFLGLMTVLILLILLCLGVSGGLWWLADLGMVLTGNILICLGIAGEYIGRTFEDARNRPLYVVASTCNLEGRP